MSMSSQDRKPLSVSQAMSIAKRALESCTLCLIGEVSEVSNKPGYKAVYFTVKDKGASMPCMMWMNRFRATGVDLRVGSLVIMTGRFTLYAPKGRMNFDVFSLKPAGEGDLRQRVADLAKRLQREGLMEQSRKRSIPLYPTKIGVVTSPRGAAIHDVLRTLRRRYPMGHVYVAGVPVEGDQAPKHLIEGIRCVCSAGVDVVVLVRGGGSFEDLMPFNDEHLAREIAASPVPVITGIGHEPDTSIADMVSDLRASTPTAAAEAIGPDILSIRSDLDQRCERMERVLTYRLDQTSAILDRYASAPFFRDAHLLYGNEAQALDILGDRLQRALPLHMTQENERIKGYQSRVSHIGASLLQHDKEALLMRAHRLDDLSPLSIIMRGYAIAQTDQGSVIASINDVHKGSLATVTVSDGSIQCEVLGSTQGTPASSVASSIQSGSARSMQAKGNENGRQ
ncbi:MAG: exodeoxyribonuclease VII large subunit [Eggerthellaceae bacterium]|nr:exodeoxyribonuclease VII large subunit [Eggerthellaceae bacterium]